MSLTFAAFLALGGFTLLAFCGDRLVTGSLELARHIGISPLLVGMFIIGFGTSLPEIILSLQAALGGHFGIAHGNIIGSNIANILLVLGTASLIAPLVTQTPALLAPTLSMLIATALWIIIASFFGLNILIGLLFLSLLICWIVLVPPSAKNFSDTEDRLTHPWLTVMKVILCLLGLPLGAKMLIAGSTDIAIYLGISETVIGLTMIAIGTSLPELAAAIAAARRAETGLVIGNVLGSNLFNILAAGGVVALVGPQTLSPELLQISHPVMAGSALLLGIIVISRLTIGKAPGLVFLAAYAGYIAILFR